MTHPPSVTRSLQSVVHAVRGGNTVVDFGKWMLSGGAP